MGNHEYAIKDFETAIEIDPDESLSHFHKGVSKLKSRMYADAIKDFERSFYIDPDNPAILDGLACCYHA